MKKNSTRILRLTIICLSLLTGCNWFDDLFHHKHPTPALLYGTGWNSKENFSQTIPVAMNYGYFQSGNSSSLPASVDLTSQFPPIGSQGQLSTCVAWAVGYSDKSYLDAVDKRLSTSQLQTANNQYSPEDLFFSIDPSRRSCDGGTNFDDAFGVLISRGVNTLAEVPYDGFCHSNSPGNPSTASANRIKSYRRIQGSINEVKTYLAQGIPVVVGAMVNKQFQLWNGSGVLSDLTYTGDEGGHAMVIAGYDDSRGAFRIINSWSRAWGDDGFAWIEYNFLLNKLCIQGSQQSLFVAFNDANNSITPPITTGGGPDLTAVVMSDYTLYPYTSPYTNARRTYFDVKNMGNQAIAASTGWNIYYLWVDAFNANNYGVIFRGEFTTTIQKNTYQDVNANYSLINFDLQPGASLSQTIMGVPSILWDYFMPALSGSYYLVLYIDKGSSSETNQTNNVFYVTQSPKVFTNGYSSKIASGTISGSQYQFEDILSFKFDLKDSILNNELLLIPYREPSREKFANSYTSREIVSYLAHKVKNGGL